MDCVGFVYRCANYKDNNYYLADLNNMEWADTHADATAYVSGRKFIYAHNEDGREGYDTLWPIGKHDQNMSNLSRLVPGDILYYKGSYHVLIVDSIEYTPGTRNVTKENIRLIEATWGDREWGKVTKEFYLEKYENNSWKFGRLITNK